MRATGPGETIEAMTARSVTDDPDGWTIPFTFPFYQPLPATYRNVRSQYVTFTADIAGIAALLPAPLVPDPSGRCVAIGLEIPESSYGRFNEIDIEVGARLGDQAGWYSVIVLHDGPAGIAAGREIYGTPKVFARFEVERSTTAMTTCAELDGVVVATVVSSIGEEVDASEVPSLAPSWRLKAIPRADRPGLAIKQLIDASSSALDVSVTMRRGGTGSVAFQASPACDLTGLAPLAHGDAFNVEASYLEGYGTIVLDYLDPAERP